MNSRLRSAIQAARSANMTKKINIEKSQLNKSIKQQQTLIFENIRYEGFGPAKSAIVVITLTDNKNRSASSIRTVLQKKGGRLGELGSTKHMFQIVVSFMSIKRKLEKK